MTATRPSPRCARPRRWPRLLAALALLLCAVTVHAYQRDFYFQRLDSGAGLAQNSVDVIAQDSRGYIWLATEGGLHRYDGYHLQRYQHDPDRTDSLPDNLITALADAGGGKLWVGSNSGGLVLFDPDRDSASPLPRTAIAPDARVYALQALPGGVLLVADGAGVQRLAAPYDFSRTLWKNPDGSDTAVTAFARCPDGAVYAATAHGVLALADTAARTRVLAQPANAVNALYCDQRGRLLLGDREGLAQVDRTSGNLIRLPLPVATAARTGVTHIVEDRAGRIWLSLSDSGLLRLDGHGHGLVVPQPQSDIAGSLPGGSIASLFVDRSGLLWVGTLAHGVAWTDPDGAAFHTIVNLAPGAQDSGANHLRTFYEAPDGTLWLGAVGAALIHYDPVSGSFENFGDVLAQAVAPQPAHGKLASAAAPAVESRVPLRVYNILPGDHGTLLVASSRGLLTFDPKARSASVLKLPGEDSSISTAPDIRALLRARNGDLWVSQYEDGVLHYRDGKLLEHYRAGAGDDALASNMVLNLVEGRNGRIWAGTVDGLSLIDPATQKVRSFHEQPGRADSLSGHAVANVMIGRDATVWVGTLSGMDRLLWIDDAGAHFRRYGTRQGLPDSTIYCMLEDAHGNVWFSTNLGIGRLNPRDGNVHSFQSSDGLQGDEYDAGACTSLRDGRLVFGGIHGFDVLDTAALKASHFQPPVVITGIRIGVQTVPVPAAGAPLNLPTAARSLHVDFAALDYSAPQHNHFRYRLLGEDDNWVDIGTRHSATWTNLEPGAYKLEVQGRSRDGTFGAAAVMPLRVQAYWWSSPAMKVLYAAVAALIAIVVLLGWRGKRLEELRHQKQLRLREDRLRLALWGSGDEFWDWDLQAGMIFRLGADGLPGGHREESIAIDDWRNFAVHPDDLERVEHALAEHVAGNSDHFEAEHRLMNTRGDWVWVISRGKIVERDESGKPLRICGTARDINALRAAERDRRIAAEVIRSMSEAVTVTDLNYHFISVNPAFTRMTGYAEEEVIGRDAVLLNCRQHAPEVYRNVRQVLSETGHWRGELWQRRKDGEEFLCWVELNEVRDSAGQPTHIVGVLTDITDRKRVEQELRYLANYDTLTGLPNRTLLGERLGHAIINARRGNHKVAVLFIDLDRFKHVNDSMGHAAGDRMLKAAGARLRHAVRERDTVARLGGDEFTVILEELADVRDAEDMGQRLIEAFQAPLGTGGTQDVLISPSIGIAMYPDHGQVPTDLLKYADTAMYQAKERGRNTYAVYHARMDTQARDRARMIAALRRALERNEFALVFQPKMSIASGRVTGCEALLRWNNAELGSIPPTVFIPLAEEIGLINEIGDFVLVSACAVLKNFRDAGLRGLSMAVNLSAAQLERPELTLRMCDILAEHDIAPDQLELELTESMVMANAEQSVRILTELKSIGVRLAIDDFGTGYSSLAYLKRLPIDTLKIDQEFVGDITIDPDDAAITSTIITMAHSLQLEVVAEGVETPEQLAFLRSQGCDEIQGHWLSMPLPAEACLKFIAARSQLARAGA
ncbi:MAG TPA: EAL domain-containing protein [Rhodanobacteraceae bacterium]|nr:EAL domain-containing protein [Rhodanobacteraceae bacterium]